MNFDYPWSLVGLGVAVFAVGVPSVLLASRGGRFRGLPGWAGFWVFFSLLLVLLSRVTPWVGYPLLGLLLLGALREYFYLAPLRTQDRWAILFAYLSVPAGLYAIFIDSYPAFLTAILIFLFLLLPTGLSLGSPEKGLLDSMGRVLLGLLVFVFCGEHLAWMAHEPPGRLELFGTLVVVSGFPQRVTGRIRLHDGVLRSLTGMLVSFAAAAGIGAWLAPWSGLEPREGLIAGLLVCLCVTAGGVVTGAVAHDLSLSASSARLGRAALLDRITPAIYAAPLYYHYVSHFA
jgi:predicted CDP-diglyceride synthetase/phosphatidate cytidylyltransferase